MTDMNIGLERWTEGADMTNQVAYTLGACTGLSACPA
jgi:hypothetical protein